MHTEPEIKQFDVQHTVGIRSQTPMSKLSEVIPQAIDEVEGWLQERGISPAGPPFIRYHVIDMEGDMDIEIGFPVDDAQISDTRITANVIPAGRYASLIYTDVTKGIEGNAALLEWIKANDYTLDSWDTEQGDAFASRVEFLLDGPDDDPDPANWRTEVAMKLADS